MTKVRSSMKDVAEDWSRYLGQLKSCPKMGRSRVGQSNAAPNGAAQSEAAKMLPQMGAEKCRGIPIFNMYGSSDINVNLAHLG